MRILEVVVALLNSRKAAVAFTTMIVALLAVFGLKDFPPEVIMVVIASLATIGGVLINAIKAEDVAKHTAAGVVAAATATAAPKPPASSTLDNTGREL